MNENLRIEHDSIGDLEVPADAYYGVQSLRGAENFKITGHMLHPLFIKNMAKIKKACAYANGYMGAFEKEKVDAIAKACDEIIAGGFMESFIVDAIQGGAGTSANMNANEVIANRAIEILGGKKGDYKIVHPNDHVNYGQSTNDVIPSAGKMTVIDLIKPLLESLNALVSAFDEKAKQFDGIIKMGRTQLQDAVPIRLGQEFAAYAAVIRRDIVRISNAEKDMHIVNMGGSAIGTCINVDPKYLEKIPTELTKVAGYELILADDLIDGTQNLDGFVNVSSALKTCAVNLSKIANDLRLMSSGPKTGIGEIALPAKQNGSSIMPGKINPVIPEVINQVAFLVIGHDATICAAAEAGQLELNAFEPVLFYQLFESISAMTNAINTFIENCVTGIRANKKQCQENVEKSAGIVTAMAPYIGYQRSAFIAKESLATGNSVRSIILRDNIMTEEELNEILDARGMTEPRAIKIKES
ncbi:MAG: aspartate ammonia-lyase [Ruminococcaceae bacterium]|nr:aspartate ammonia-lyase [Oscillospiraceae bacterium]